ncbi:Crossover junction endodeoxyribonuclease RuvC [Candidatus Hepatincolaceae symbiont of Richtersius coronifer]
MKGNNKAVENSISQILGIDPGLNFTGWSYIKIDKSSIILMNCGIIKPNNKLNISDRLVTIYEELKLIISTVQPGAVAIEETFINKDPQSALKLGYARGIVLMVPSLFKIPVFEYSPNTIKKTVAGNGHASKEQMRAMINLVLPKTKQLALKEDEIDAIAIALCHAYHQRSY